MLNYLQRIGRSLMLPVAVLPAAAILVAIANIIAATIGQNAAYAFFFNAGMGVLENLGLLFAIGVAIGMAKKNDGATALAAIVGFLVVDKMLDPENVAVYLGIAEKAVNPGFTNIGFGNVFVGIAVGLIAASCYNKFSAVELPDAFAFFSGKRLVPIMTALFSVILAFVLLFIWPFVYSALVAFGKSIIDLGAVGAGIYGVANRLLIPLGLHHALNAVFWFDIAGINDVANFQAQTGTKGITGRYMAGFFPIMMFGIPAAALAMYHTAQTKYQKQVGSIMFAGAISAFIVGITEPIEFVFMFVAPLLYVVHALLTGLSLFIAALFHWTAGFAFSAGLIDFVLSLINPFANHPLMLVVQGLVFFVLYYVIFRFLIVKFNLNTPGRGTNIPTSQVVDSADTVSTPSASKYAQTATTIIEGLGGKENITSLTNCATRLRLELADNTKINEAQLKSAGSAGILKNGQHATQVIIGTHVQQVADEMERQLEL
ncbi:N-acetylglucosamine-specific PTS transporter subunit IIBC [Staphylococcus americanisciuri]|uniref:N-acetylglucosamine-specific PTS transporter subunit IIBC n=1 Tax=Staphylococcus americanisciuri TaxID=2973940 RepID=A0ABT2F4K1_9STAP|nr:N-acetylglucosamine-specific PTS transporter subunit IIBC [Staphylococcus americanisciuri]MCS4487108.1 N-acetylglucosamine-specific PTS transporter subunit IIBC [Staphylococcus americanisciuri]